MLYDDRYWSTRYEAFTKLARIEHTGFWEGFTDKLQRCTRMHLFKFAAKIATPLTLSVVAGRALRSQDG